MRIQYILHADFELPGIIEEWAKQNNFIQTFCRPFAGEKIPNLNEYDILILLGGPQSPLNIDESPYLKDEILLIEKTIKAQIPVLGFCLGAQLIGEALGARTERSPNKEVGVFPIELTAEGYRDPLLKDLPKQFLVVHWHNDMPGITAESKILATSKGCPRQIIRYSPLIYGFQCHPEPTKENIETMIEHCLNDLTPGKFIQSSEELLSNNFPEINNKMIQILNNLIASMKCLEEIKHHKHTMNKAKEDCFHLGVKALILNPEQKILLLERNHPKKGIYWDIPGGRLQKGESQMETLFREIEEEIGLTNFSEIHPFVMTLTDIRISTPEKDVGLIFSIFIIKISEIFNPILSNKHTSFLWASLDESSQKLKQYPKIFTEKLLEMETMVGK